MEMITPLYLSEYAITEREWLKIALRLSQKYPKIHWDYDYEDRRLLAMNPWTGNSSIKGKPIYLSWEAKNSVVWQNDESLASWTEERCKRELVSVASLRQGQSPKSMEF